MLNLDNFNLFSEDEEDNHMIDSEYNDFLDLIGQKCSICFTEESDYEIPLCGDQFCYNCIETGKLKETSWGLRPAIIDCPVCRAVVRDTTFLQWASPEFRDLYHKNARKRNCLKRSCHQCGHEQSITGEHLDESLEELFVELQPSIKPEAQSQILRKIQSHDLTGALRHLSRNLAEHRSEGRLIFFLRKLLQESSLDDGEVFTNKQLYVVSMSPGTICDFCTSELCLRCGYPDWHNEQSCLEYMRKAIPNEDPETATAMEWTINNCKPCPKCFLLISKEEDGSCNQMKCNNCSFSYCWECLKEWSPSCGFYNCKSSTSRTSSHDDQGKDLHLESKIARVEAGIPDVTKLPSISPRSINAFQSYEALQNELILQLGDGSAPSALEILTSSGVCVEDLLPFRELRAKALNAISKQVASKETGNINVVQYGVEIRHMPVSKYLASSSKYVDTEMWAFARDELKFSKFFDRIMELRAQNSWCQGESRAPSRVPPRKLDDWDALLEEMKWMSEDYASEARWKQAVAKQLAEEAVAKVKGYTSMGKQQRAFIADREFLKSVCQNQVYDDNSTRRSTAIEAIAHSFDDKMDDESADGVPLPWSPLEVESLLGLIDDLGTGPSATIVASILNCVFHGKRPVRKPQDVSKKLQQVKNNEVQDTPSLCKHLFDRSLLMNAVNTKLTTPKPSVPPKKMNMTAHPSHDLAARKANQNISKLFTPQELAQRRIQRTRVMTDANGSVSVATNSAAAGSAIPTPSKATPTPGSPSLRPPGIQGQGMSVASTPIRPPAAPISAAMTVRPPQAGSTAIRPPGAPVANPLTLQQQQQRQAMINRSQQIGNYIASMQGRPTGRVVAPVVGTPIAGVGIPAASIQASASHAASQQSSPPRPRPPVATNPAVSGPVNRPPAGLPTSPMPPQQAQPSSRPVRKANAPK